MCIKVVKTFLFQEFFSACVYVILWLLFFPINSLFKKNIWLSFIFIGFFFHIIIIFSNESLFFFSSSFLMLFGSLDYVRMNIQIRDFYYIYIKYMCMSAFDFIFLILICEMIKFIIIVISDDGPTKIFFLVQCCLKFAASCCILIKNGVWIEESGKFRSIVQNVCIFRSF